MQLVKVISSVFFCLFVLFLEKNGRWTVRDGSSFLCQSRSGSKTATSDNMGSTPGSKMGAANTESASAVLNGPNHPLLSMNHLPHSLSGELPSNSQDLWGGLHLSKDSGTQILKSLLSGSMTILPEILV